MMTQKQDNMSHINLRKYLICILLKCNQVVGYSPRIIYKVYLPLVLLLMKMQFFFILFLIDYNK